MHAPPFPEPWGFNHIVNENGSNLLNASLDAWKQSATDINQTSGHLLNNVDMGMAGLILFGFIPIVLTVIIMLRFRNIVGGIITLSLTTILFGYLRLLPALFYQVYIVMIALGIGFMIYDLFKGKKGGY